MRAKIQTTDFARIIASTPLDKTAAIVAGGGNDDEDLTPLQTRQNLVGLLGQIERAIKKNPEPERRKWLGSQKLEIQNRLRDLPRVVPRNQRDFSSWIVDVVKERVPSGQFRLILEEAQRRYNAATTTPSPSASGTGDV